MKHTDYYWPSATYRKFESTLSLFGNRSLYFLNFTAIGMTDKLSGAEHGNAGSSDVPIGKCGHQGGISGNIQLTRRCDVA